LTEAPVFAAPVNTAELADAIRAAMDERRPLELRGAGTWTDIGDPRRERSILDMRGFGGIISYEPEELVLTVGAATPLAEVERLLAANGQRLAFEPRGGTIGGVVAAGVSGPRRPYAGGVRDHILGLEGVSGRGEPFRAGGKVVKNVTGYDLPRLMTGSWGRLAAITSVSIKVAPKPRTEASVLVEGLDDAGAVLLMGRASGSAAEISGAAHIPGVGTALRLEGFGPSVAARIEMLRALCGDAAPRLVEGEGSPALWRGVRDASGLPQDLPLWRVTGPAAAGARLTAGLMGASRLYDWAGGLVWIAAPESVDIRGAAKAVGGEAMLVRANAAMRGCVGALHPEPPGLAALRARIKRGFDPVSILDPARFGIG
jgi:glycolate oxidase FAD binding subunit